MTTNARKIVLETIEVLSSPSEQLKFLDIGELKCCSDGWFQPKSSEFIEAFTNDELLMLAHLYGLFVEACKTSAKVDCIGELLKNEDWRKVVSLAKDLTYEFHRST